MAFDWGGFAGGFARGLEPGYRLGKAISEDMRASDFAKQVKAINERYDNEATLAKTDYATVDAINKGKDVQQAVNIARNGEVPILQEGIRQIGMENPETGKIELTQNRTVDPALGERLAATNRHPGLTDNTPVRAEHLSLADTLRAVEDGREAAFQRAQMQYYARNPEKMAELMKQRRESQFKQNLFKDWYGLINNDPETLQRLAEITPMLGVTIPEGSRIQYNGDGTYTLVYASGEHAGEPVVDQDGDSYINVRPTPEMYQKLFAKYATMQKAAFDRDWSAMDAAQDKEDERKRKDRELQLKEREVDIKDFSARSTDAYRQGLLSAKGSSGFSIPKDWKIGEDETGRAVYQDKHGRAIAAVDPETQDPLPFERSEIVEQAVASGMKKGMHIDPQGHLSWTIVDPETGDYAFPSAPGKWYKAEGKPANAVSFPSMAGSSTRASGGKYGKYWTGASGKRKQAVAPETPKESAGKTEEAKPAPAKEEPPTKSAGKPPQTSGAKQRSIYDEIDETKGSGWDSQQYPDVYDYLDATKGNSPASAIPAPPSKESERFVNHKGYSTRVAQGDLRPTTAQRLWDKAEQANQERFGDISRMNDRELTTINAARAKAGQPPKYREEFKESRADDLARLKNVAKAELNSRKKEAIPTKTPAKASKKAAIPTKAPTRGSGGTQTKLPTKGRILQRANEQMMVGGNKVPGGKNVEYRVEAKQGEEIPSVDGGKVVFSDWMRGKKHVVIIERKDGSLETITGVMSSKKLGDTVKAGEIVGVVEGNDYGYAVRVNGKVQD